ncbi:MAG: trans-aconitate 2-methyltransferase, partial [Mycobacterium sp.]|nr:trans-aconitate 2-methyltransferase [Mycobacterium sp.]
MWDPEVYLAFADQRARPFYDLLSWVGAERPRRVVDLGCGAGNLTAQLARRWPEAVIEALDSSPEMVAAARERGVDATVGDLRTWTPRPDTDVVLSNAAAQWVPEHAELMVRWAGELAAGSWIAVQMPGNFESPSHAAVRAVARREAYAKPLRDVPFRVGTVVGTPASYARQLIDAGCTVDAWETTYLHQLTGE